MEYIKFSSEEIEKARNTDIMDFLSRNYGFEFQKVGKDYRCKQHDSLNIFSDRHGWKWYSKDVGGANVIDFMMRIERKSFTESISDILGQNFAVYNSSDSESRETESSVVLPEKTHDKFARVYAYLCQTRKLDKDVISDMMKEKKIYQDTKGNCVFVGYDDTGKAKFGCVRGTLTDKKYRGDCQNSDKRYAFSQSGTEKDIIYIFESPIDLLSHCTMANMIKNDKNAYKQQTRISLCGTSDVALQAYLERHPEVKVLNFRLDNDEAGHQQTEKYIAEYTAKGYKVNAVFSKGKDVNEDLVNMSENKQTKNKPMKR